MSLKDYIQGKKQGKEANRLEREAMNDPFLQEALDGFEKVAGEHVEIIDRLEKRFSTPTLASQKNRNIFLYWSVAASVLLLIVFGTYFLLEKNRQSFPLLAEVQLMENESIIPIDTSMVLLAQIKEESQQKTLIAVEDNKARPASTITFSPPIMNEDESSSFSDNVVATSEAVELSDLPEAPLVTEFSEKRILTQKEKQIIRGIIVDETGEPLAGVSVLKKGTQDWTVTDVDGVFILPLPINDSSKLIASFIGYESQEINPFNENQTVSLKPDDRLLDEVITVGYGTQKKSAMSSAVSKKDDSIQSSFGEKEFQIYCKQNANKDLCNGNSVTLKVSFFIDDKGKPSKIEYKKYSCEDAKEEMNNLFSSSPVWTKTNRKVTMTIKW